MTAKIALPLLFTLASLAGCSAAGGETYTLYRDSPVSDERVHMATFDAEQSGPYNQDNCETARELFQQQPGVVTTYWCEKGRYRK